MAVGVLAAPATAQTIVNQNWTDTEQRAAGSITARLNRQAGFNVAVDRSVGPPLEFATDYQPIAAGSPFAATTTRDFWREGEGGASGCACASAASCVAPMGRRCR